MGSLFNRSDSLEPVFGQCQYMNSKDIKERIVTSSKAQSDENKDGVLLTIKSLPVAWYDIPTSNKMTYPRELWQILFDDKDYVANVNERRSYYGEDDHYDDDHVKWDRVSQRFVNIGFSKTMDNVIESDVEIIDTARGRNLFACASSGGIGFSTRGLARMVADKSRGDGYVVLVPDSYYDICIDAVVNPAVSVARYVSQMDVRSSINSGSLISEITGHSDLAFSRVSNSELKVVINGKYRGSKIHENLLVGILEDVESGRLPLVDAVAVCSMYQQGSWLEVMKKEQFNSDFIRAIENSL